MSNTTVKLSSQNNRTFRSKKRVRNMSVKAKESFKQNCAPFYDFDIDNFKQRNDIIKNVKCKPGKTGNMLYYKRDDSDEYNFIPQKQLNENGCYSNYNTYSSSEDTLEANDLLINCSKDQFKDVNKEYVSLLKYIEDLSKQLDVDIKINEFIYDLIEYTNINLYGIKELFNGAFVIIKDDNGYFFYKYKSSGRMCNTRKKISESSHDTLFKDGQYRMGKGILYNCDTSKNECSLNTKKKSSVFDLLVGTSPIENYYGDTWIQFEYANILGFKNKFLLHGYSFLAYKYYGKNIGPLGTSEYTEYTKPLILEVCKDKCLYKKCVPIKCVRPIIDLKKYSSNFLEENKIDLLEYKSIKDYIKKNISFGNKISINDILFDINDYIEASESIDLTILSSINLKQLELLKKMIVYLQEISGTKKYEKEEVVEIMFLILFYVNNTKNLEEFKSKIEKRYYKSSKSSNSNRSTKSSNSNRSSKSSNSNRSTKSSKSNRSSKSSRSINSN